jgi:hypothetical protein
MSTCSLTPVRVTTTEVTASGSRCQKGACRCSDESLINQQCLGCSAGSGVYTAYTSMTGRKASERRAKPAGSHGQSSSRPRHFGNKPSLYVTVYRGVCLVSIYELYSVHGHAACDLIIEPPSRGHGREMRPCGWLRGGSHTVWQPCRLGLRRRVIIKSSPSSSRGAARWGDSRVSEEAGPCFFILVSFKFHLA